MRRFVWSFIHNCVAHPLMWFTADAQWAVRLHDYSALTAWPERLLRRPPVKR